jgi:hypothetical protein
VQSKVQYNSRVPGSVTNKELFHAYSRASIYTPRTLQYEVSPPTRGHCGSQQRIFLRLVDGAHCPMIGCTVAPKKAKTYLYPLPNPSTLCLFSRRLKHAANKCYLFIFLSIALSFLIRRWLRSVASAEDVFHAAFELWRQIQLLDLYLLYFLFARFQIISNHSTTLLRNSKVTWYLISKLF